MEDKVFLLSKKSKFRIDADVKLNVDLESKSKVMVNTDLGETLSLYDLYNTERDNSTKFRLIIDINPICTNVLFNNVTEVVKYSGSTCYALTVAGEKISKLPGLNKEVVNYKIANSKQICRHDAINDTEFSHSDFGDFIYMCGSDIFNNHILRAKDFIHVGLSIISDVEYDRNARMYFNTILDYQRDSKGKVLSGSSYSSSDANATMKYHIYTLDGLYSLTDAFTNKCIDKDGWFGFENRTMIDIPNVLVNSKKYVINRAINNKNACSFIDMYPGRELYSFTPIYNKNLLRTERNWDYCLTYPFESDYEKFNEINENGINAIKVIKTEITYGNSGEELIQLTTLMKHNLKRGSFISLYYKQNAGVDGSIDKVPYKVKVSAIGDSEGNNSDIIIRIRMNDVSSYFESEEGRVVAVGGRKCRFFIKKVSDGSECKYYFRKFKKIKYGSDVPTSEINKLALAKNIYGDNVSQIIYTDDIDVDGLTDNLGMPLSKLYLTIVKANRGNIEWYENNNYSNVNIECSHAFGKVTSGIELPESYYDYNIHKLHNIELSDFDKYSDYTGHTGYTGYTEGTKAVFSNFATKPKVLEGSGASGVTVEGNDVFYGDIVEFDFSQCDETVIDYVYHRFNTKQREVCNIEYFDIIEDSLLFDDYYHSKGASVDTIDFQIPDFKRPLNTDSQAASGIDIGGQIPVYKSMSIGNRNDNLATTNKTPNVNVNVSISDIANGVGTSNLNTSSTQESFDLDNDEDRVSTSLLNVATIANVGNRLYAGNIAPEGYYYKPHHEIVIREKSDTINELSTNFINYNAKDVSVVTGSTTIVYSDNTQDTVYWSDVNIKSPIDYKFKPGDIIVFYFLLTDSTRFGVIDGVSGTNIHVRVNDELIDIMDLKNYRIAISHTDKECPLYAKFSMQNQVLVWRDIVKPSETLSDSDLYNRPFSNGAFYVHKNINFFLRRQDPDGEYYMLNPEDDYRGVGGVAKHMRPFRMKGYGKLMLDAIKYMEEYLKSDCM